MQSPTERKFFKYYRGEKKTVLCSFKIRSKEQPKLWHDIHHGTAASPASAHGPVGTWLFLPLKRGCDAVSELIPALPLVTLMSVLHWGPFPFQLSGSPALCSGTAAQTQPCGLSPRPWVLEGWTRPSVTRKALPSDQVSVCQVRGVEGMVCKSHRDHKGKGYSGALLVGIPETPCSTHRGGSRQHSRTAAATRMGRQGKRGAFLRVKVWPCLCQAGNVPMVQRDTGRWLKTPLLCYSSTRQPRRNRYPLEERQERVTESSFWKMTGKGALK